MRGRRTGPYPCEINYVVMDSNPSLKDWEFECLLNFWSSVAVPTSLSCINSLDSLALWKKVLDSDGTGGYDGVFQFGRCGFGRENFIFRSVKGRRE